MEDIVILSELIFYNTIIPNFTIPGIDIWATQHPLPEVYYYLYRDGLIMPINAADIDSCPNMGNIDFLNWAAKFTEKGFERGLRALKNNVYYPNFLGMGYPRMREVEPPFLRAYNYIKFRENPGVRIYPDATHPNSKFEGFEDGYIYPPMSGRLYPFTNALSTLESTLGIIPAPVFSMIDRVHPPTQLSIDIYGKERIFSLLYRCPERRILENNGRGLYELLLDALVERVKYNFMMRGKEYLRQPGMKSRHTRSTTSYSNPVPTPVTQAPNPLPSVSSQTQGPDFIQKTDRNEVPHKMGSERDTIGSSDSGDNPILGDTVPDSIQKDEDNPGSKIWSFPTILAICIISIGLLALLILGYYLK